MKRRMAKSYSLEKYCLGCERSAAPDKPDVDASGVWAGQAVAVNVR